MVTLYVKDNCPFCAVVLKVVDDLDAPVTVCNIAEPIHYDTVVNLGGKAQFPFMTDDEGDVRMYESADIAQYLEEKFAAPEEVAATK